MVQVHVGEPPRYLFYRTRGSQRTRLTWDQEKPGATPGCPTIFPSRQIAQTDEQRAEDATRLVQFQLWRPTFITIRGIGVTASTIVFHTVSARAALACRTISPDHPVVKEGSRGLQSTER